MTPESDAHRLAALTEAARSWRGGSVNPAPGFVPEPGETVYYTSADVELIELRDTQPPLMGGSSAYEYDVAARMAVPAAATRSIWLTESVPPRDTGWLVVTDRRVVLVGRREREWTFEHLVDLTHDDAVPETWLTVHHRKRTSGIRYAGVAAVDLRFCLAVALAEARGARAALHASLVDQARRSAPLPSGAGWVAPPVKATGKVPALLRRVYLGKPGTALPLRVAQGGLAALATLALIGSVLPDQAASPTTQLAVEAADERSSRVDEQAQVAAEAERAAAADAERVAAEQAAAAQVAADAAAAEEAAADEAAADQAAADKAAEDKAAADTAAAERAAAERAEADRLAAEAAAAQRAEDEAAASEIQPLAAAPQSGSGCTPEYPDFCIPSGKGDYNCPDFSQKNFTALAPDPYGLDRNRDGVACESN